MGVSRNMVPVHCVDVLKWDSEDNRNLQGKESILFRLRVPPISRSGENGELQESKSSCVVKDLPGGTEMYPMVQDYAPRRFLNQDIICSRTLLPD
jgi:hypothetical protein